MSVTRIHEQGERLPRRRRRPVMRGAGLCTLASWVGMLVVGCGRADSGERPVRSNDEGGSETTFTIRPDASPDGGDDAGASSPAAECPAPLVNTPQGAQPVWVRNPATGDCCRYAPVGAVPIASWPMFYTEDSCLNDCRCGIGDDGEVQFRTTIECICSVEDCPASIEEAEQLLCSNTSALPVAAVQRLEGCGMVMVVDRNGFSGSGWVFEQPLAPADEPRLVGSTRFSDASYEACTPDVWGAGPDFFDCEEVVTCQLCGESPGPQYPPCE